LANLRRFAAEVLPAVRADEPAALPR